MVQGATILLDVLTVLVQIFLHALQLCAILLELGPVGGDLRFAGVTGFVRGQLLFVLLDD